MYSAPASDLLFLDLIATYLARCAAEGKSPHTIAAYCETLTRFQRCLQEDGVPLDPDRCRPDHEIAYLARFADHRPTTRHPPPLLPRGALLLELCAPPATLPTTPSAASIHRASQAEGRGFDPRLPLQFFLWDIDSGRPAAVPPRGDRRPSAFRAGRWGRLTRAYHP